MSTIQLLRAASSLGDLAGLLNFQQKTLAYVLYKIPEADKYHAFKIPKRGGGFRDIKSPRPELKRLQRNLADLLQDCISDINLQKQFPDMLSHGFKRGRSIYSNATKHKNRRFVFNIDLEDFFGTINFGRVRGFFIKDANFMLSADVATRIAQIACHENSLPQGSPCSPVISNLIGHLLDIRLCQLASKNGCTYSRYADDISFSTNRPLFPKAIAKQEPSDPHGWQVGDGLGKAIQKSGFLINLQKTRMQYDGSRQNVTGLVVNRKVNIRNDYRRTVKSMANALFATGKYHSVEVSLDAAGATVLMKTPGTIARLHGMISHIDFVDSSNCEQVEKRKTATHDEKDSARKLLYSKHRLYRRFLLYKDFYAAQRPVIVCEGKTDNVYLLYAIKALAAYHPNLATVDPNNKVELKLRVLRTFESSAGRILRLASGWSGLKGLIEYYEAELKRFKSPGQHSPVILLIDNDDAVDKISETLKKLKRAPLSKTASYTRIMGNMYVVTTPLGAGQKQSQIEDCFDGNIKALVLNGKTFSSDEKADTNLHFGKHILSQYVRQNASTINFAGFSELLNRIDSVMNDYEQLKATKVGVASFFGST